MLHISNFLIKEIKGRTVFSSKYNVENKASKVGFTLQKIKLLGNFKLKMKLTETIFNNQFYTRFPDSFQLPSAI